MIWHATGRPRRLPIRVLRALLALALVGSVASPAAGRGGEIQSEGAGRGWPVYGSNQANTNANLRERQVGPAEAPFLRRAWETFNDDGLNPEPPPTGFLLESALGLRYPTSVVGITASPLIDDETLYYVDQLGTVFARNADSGRITNTARHWTTALVDPDFDDVATPVLPELYYTAPVLTNKHVWLVGSAYGRLHAVERRGGQEVDFDLSTPGIQPLTLIDDLPFSSALGDPVVVKARGRALLIAGVNVILNDALIQGQEGGVQIAIDITNPQNPIEAWRTFSLDTNQATGLRFGSGASVGAGLAVDPGLGLIYGGTGQNTSEPYPGYPDTALAPPGYIDRSDSLYAIDYATGDFVWTNQFHNGDVFTLSAVGDRTEQS